MHKEQKSLEETFDLLNKQSGITGISGISNDMRDIEKGVDEGHIRATLAQDMYVYRIKKYVGAYLSVMNGADALVFTGGVGENDPMVRRKVCNNMEYVGLLLDDDLNTNAKRGVESKISKQDSKIAVYIIPTDEELMIARDTYCIVSGKEILE